LATIAAAGINLLRAEASPAPPQRQEPSVIRAPVPLDAREPVPTLAPSRDASKARPVSRPEATYKTEGAQSPIVNTGDHSPVIFQFNQPVPEERKAEPPVTAAPIASKDSLDRGQRNGIRYYETQWQQIEEALESSDDPDAPRVLEQAMFYHRQNVNAIGDWDFPGSTKAVNGLNGVLHKKPIRGIDASLIYQHDPCQDDRFRPGCFRLAGPIIPDK